MDPKRGITFANSLRALLRQDPDVIFVGEIRDAETAQIAAQAAMTGHLVLATMHTNDAMATIARLLDLGLDRQTIAATLRGTLAQRLIRRICTDCAQPVTGALTEEEENLAKRYNVQPAMRAVGCKRCGNTGYRGRLPLIEVSVITPALSDLIAAGATATVLQRAAISHGMAPLRDVAIARVRRGETTLQECERVIGDQIEDTNNEEIGPAHILIVNADAAWRTKTRLLLETGGFRVTEAENAAQAMQLVSAGEQFALIVTDLMSPALMDSVAQARAAGHRLSGQVTPRASGAMPAIPITPPSAPVAPPPATEAKPQKDLDWARFAATVQKGIRRTEH